MRLHIDTATINGLHTHRLEGIGGQLGVSQQRVESRLAIGGPLAVVNLGPLGPPPGGIPPSPGNGAPLEPLGPIGPAPGGPPPAFPPGWQPSPPVLGPAPSIPPGAGTRPFTPSIPEIGGIKGQPLPPILRPTGPLTGESLFTPEMGVALTALPQGGRTTLEPAPQPPPQFGPFPRLPPIPPGQAVLLELGRLLIGGPFVIGHDIGRSLLAKPDEQSRVLVPTIPDP